MRWLVACWVALMLACSFADARPGGGHSFSSGGSHSSSYRSSSSHSSGGGSGGFGAGTVLGLVVAIVIVIAIIKVGNAFTTPSGWTSSNARPAPHVDFAPLVARDPAFSIPVFEDFVVQLYARARRAKPPDVAALTPYFAAPVLAQLGNGCDAVVLGSLRVLDVRTDDREQRIAVRIEANLAQTTGTAHVIERWTFARATGVATRAPDKVRAFPCPHCGAPFTAGSTPRTCAHCGREMVTGSFEWTVVEATMGVSTPVGPTLTGTVPEVGNELPTLVAADAHITFQTLSHADPNVTWDAFVAHIQMVYDRLNETWNAQDLTKVRGLVTSSLLQYLQFWIDEYKRQRLANQLTDAAISHVALAKVTRDPYYDAITVRLYASGFDYTVSTGDGKDVGGSRTSKRAYTEYWTFVRSANRKGPVTRAPTCPNCGAPLAISDAGACTHCNAEIENGSFDWVLSKIEQDEVYAG